jgi:hypothetical protein
VTLKSMKTVSPGKVLLSVSTIWAAVGPYVFDWNETHIYNPEWPPHAKFHNAQTMSTGVALGAAGLYTTWARRGRWTPERLQVSTAAASLYWITQLSTVLYPGTALFDHGRGQATAPPRIRGPQPFVASVALAVNALAYAMERRRLGRTDRLLGGR